MRLRAGDEVIEVDIAADDSELLVVTENGWGKRTRVSEYPVKGRGGLGVKTAQLVVGKGKLIGARIVREGYQVMLISDGGTMIKMSADDIKRSGRATQGVIVMRLREGEQVSSLAPVVGSDDDAEPDDGTDEPGPEDDAPNAAIDASSDGLDADVESDDEQDEPELDADEEPDEDEDED